MDKRNPAGMPGAGQMTDTLEFMKNLWGSMGVPGMTQTGTNQAGMQFPGMVMPTLSVEEINKKISDLKAVESWLTLNMNMLRGTIQALEVQSATITALQSMGETLSSAVASASGNGQAAAGDKSGSDRKSAAASQPSSKDNADAATLTAPFVNATAWWNMLQEQFKQAVNQAMTEPNSGSDASGTSAGNGAGKPTENPKPETHSKRKSTKS